MKRVAIAIAVLFPMAALAQSARTSTNVSSTIAVTNTFQSVLAPSINRMDCAIQDNGANTEWVFFGPIASATKAGSFVLTPGQAVNCAHGGVSLGDQVSITGTAGDTFAAAWQ